MEDRWPRSRRDSPFGGGAVIQPDQPLLTFELSPDHEQLHVFANAHGIEEFIRVLRVVAASKDHEHLATPSWAGHRLSEEPQLEEGALLHKVTIQFVASPPERPTTEAA